MKYNFSQQRGAVLIIGLILLITTTLIALTSLQSIQLQWRIWQQYRHQQQWFKQADATLDQIEQHIDKYMQPHCLIAPRDWESLSIIQTLSTTPGCTVSLKEAHVKVWVEPLFEAQSSFYRLTVAYIPHVLSDEVESVKVVLQTIGQWNSSHSWQRSSWHQVI